jgi:hypothetical protein
VATGWQFRPAKQMQRLMVIDVMRRLRAFRPLVEYRYVGFGGYEFVDFDLVRRQLGIYRMVSIERSGKPDRYEFNRPFPDIELKFGNSNEMLPEVALEEPLIVWMDYCGKVDGPVLSDVLLFGEKLQPGSMLMVTVNATSDDTGKRLSSLEARVTPARVPMGISRESDFDSWGTADVQRRILAGEVRAGLANRSDATRFEQLVNIRYKDTTRMQTWGAVFVSPATDGLFDRAAFRDLDQVRTGEEALTISVPVLTAREVLELEKKLRAGAKPPTLPWLKGHEAQSFSDLHRWYPPVPAPM